MSPRDLVCARCWNDFFNTKDFEECCTWDPYHDLDKYGSVGGVATTKQIRDAADCNWCAYLREFIRDSWMPDDIVTTNLVPCQIDSCTPKGRNVLSLSISCDSPSGKWMGGYSLFLHAWTTSEDNASEYVTARPLRTDVDSETAALQLRTWYAECVGHEGCSALHKDSSLPTRVIEVSPQGRQHPRLLETGNSRGIYATLSYCWGEAPFSTLTRSNYNQSIEGFDMLTLPLTIRHAITTARSLSIPYLWIDALCIVQDSEEDKAREIARMKDIYASSALTIVAASAKSVSEGFINPRVHSEPFYTIPVRIRPGVFGTMAINELDAASYDERFEPLAKRAWTMQEQLLAQRTLTFTTRTMMWTCPAGTKNFGESLHFPHDLDSGYNDNDEKYSLNLHNLLLSEGEAHSNRDKTLSCWLRAVTAYSLRVASLERDKLNAIAGIASHPSFSRALGPRYFAGLWQYELARQLTWRTSRWHRTLPDNDTCIINRPAKYRAPSWSWASLDGGVIHFDFSFDDEDETVPDVICDIIDCSTTSRSPELNPFGEVLSAQLRVKAAARWAWFGPSTQNIFLLSESGSSTAGITAPTSDERTTFAEATTRHIDDLVARHPDVDLAEDPETAHGTDRRNVCGSYDETENNEDPVIVLCVAITLNRDTDSGVEGLLLVPSEINGDNNTFKRIGSFERGRNEDFPRETQTEICII